MNKIYKDELLAEWRRLRDTGEVFESDWDDFLGCWEEENGSLYKGEQ